MQNLHQLAAHILATTANNLRPHQTTPHPYAGHYQPCISNGLIDSAVREATGPVLETIRGINWYTNQRLLQDTVKAMLPPTVGTVAAYADRLEELAAAQPVAA